MIIKDQLGLMKLKSLRKKSLYDWIKNTKPMFDPNLFKKFFLHPSKEFLLQANKYTYEIKCLNKE